MTETEADVELDVPEIRVPGGFPGFPDLERYTLVSWGGEGSPFAKLQSLDEPDTATFVVVPPNVFFPDYAPVVGTDLADELGLEKAEDALLLAIVTVGQPVQASTVNLLGPIIVNVNTRVAGQAILDPDKYSATAPIVTN